MIRSIASSVLASVGVCVLMAGMAPQAHAQAPEPMVGKWSMNTAKSTSSGPLAKSRDLDITQQGAAVTVKVHEVSADGTTLNWSFTTTRDGKPAPVTGWAVIDTATSTITGRTGKTTYSKAGKVVMESNTTVSADGKTLVITGTRPGTGTTPITFSTHYDRK